MGNGKDIRPQEENARLRRLVCCSKCQVNYKGVLFVPCRHVTMCMTCASVVKDCPECNTHIDEKINVILTPSIQTIFSENARLKSTLYCNLCKAQPKNVLFFPCLHHLLCIDCARDMKVCSVCMTGIENTLKTFRS